MFGHPDVSNININISNASRINNEEAENLLKEFSEKEIKNAVFSMEHNKAPGPDGFNIEFYQHFWYLIKDDLNKMFNDFHRGQLNIARLNYGIVTLVPKCKDARQIQKFRPICLLNVSFKKFTKVLMKRLEMTVEKIISPVQTAFIKGRFIMEGVLILHEALNDIDRKSVV